LAEVDITEHGSPVGEAYEELYIVLRELVLIFQKAKHRCFFAFPRFAWGQTGNPGERDIGQDLGKPTWDVKWLGGQVALKSKPGSPRPGSLGPRTPLTDCQGYRSRVEWGSLAMRSPRE